jgi:uncharacterized membrane protein YhiD involved in acid resistance
MDLTELTNPQVNLFAYSYTEVILNILVAIMLGFVISFLYRVTHRGLSYSQSFTLTVLFVTVIVAVVMMVIGGSLARAFALVGALSIIRFRTVIKDTKDTAFVFLALAVGMAAGTSNYFVAFVSTIMIGALVLIVDHYKYGALYKSDFVIRFLFTRTAQGNSQQAPYLDVFEKLARTSNLLHVEPTGDSAIVRMTFDVSLKEETEPADFVASLSALANLDDIVLIASKNDVDY